MIKAKHNRTAVFGLAITTSLMGLSPTAYARPTASQLTKPSYAPPVIRESGNDNFDKPRAPQALNAPSGSENLYVRPSGLNVQGGLPDMAAKTQQLEAKIRNRRVSSAQLFNIAQQLEADYQRAGYPFIRVTVPPQNLRDGEALQLVVVHGYIDKIDVSALPKVVQGHVKKVLAPLLYNNTLTSKQLERQLLLASDTPGLLMRSTLKAGNKPQSTTLVISGHHDVVTGSLSIDNDLSDSLGTYTTTLALQANDLFGAGETSYVSVGGYPTVGKQHIFGTDPRNSQVVAGVTLPLNNDGLWANIEGVDSRTHGNAKAPVSISDHFQRVSAKLGMKWLRTRNLNTSSIISFDYANELQKLRSGDASQEFSKDKLRVVRFTQTGNMYNRWGGQFSGSVTASIGLDGLGARSATDVLPLSRQGAEPDFKKLAVYLSYVQPLLNDTVNASISGQAQTSFNAPLVSSEQMVMGGMDGISAYDNGDIPADTGGLVRAELSLPLTIPLFSSSSSWGSAVSPYVFGSIGLAKLENPTAVENGMTHTSSYGVGMRIGVSQAASHNSTSLRLEYARGSATGRDDDNRFNVRFVTQF